MADPNIRIKRSSVAGKRPTISQLELGELALNTNDGRLFTRKYNVGIGSTVTLLSPWTENIGGGLYYTEGNIGIGLTNPSSTLDISGTVNISGVSTFSNNVDIGGTVSIGTTIDIVPYNDLGTLSFEGSAGQLFNITNNLSSGSIFSINPISGIPIVDVQADRTIRLNPFGGNTGIGITNPTEKLEVVGNVKVSGLITTQNLYVSGITTSTGGFFGDLTGNADTATYSTSTGIATYATLAGISTNVVGGIGSITTLTVSGISTFSNNVNIAGTVSIGTTVDIVPYDDLGTLSFEGSAGQLFSITNNLTSGSIFSVNDVSGIPSIDVDADGTIQLAPFGSTEYVGVGLTNPTAKLDVAGDINVSGIVTANSYNVGTDAGISTTRTTVATTAATTIDSFAVATYRSARVQVQITQGTDYQASDVLMIHDGSTASLVEYASIATNDYLGTLSSTISGSDCLLQINMNSATSATVKVLSQRITV